MTKLLALVVAASFMFPGLALSEDELDDFQNDAEVEKSLDEGIGEDNKAAEATKMKSKKKHKKTKKRVAKRKKRRKAKKKKRTE